MTLADWFLRWRSPTGGMVRSRTGNPMPETSTSTRSDAVPEGWPPPTPVEVLRVGRTLANALIAAIVLNALTLLGLVWAVCYHGREETSLLGGILHALQK